MKFTLEYPIESPTATDGFLHPQAIRQVCQQAEASWFSAVALSEHPAPSAKWRRRGGHDTLDPIAALGFMAGVTSTVKLVTNLYVLPFRNPYLSAKALTSLDLVSGGRLIAGVGAGYLRSEFAALGVDFDRRAELLDEALAALWSIWMDPEIPVAGSDFGAVGELWLQRPRNGRIPAVDRRQRWRGDAPRRRVRDRLDARDLTTGIRGEHAHRRYFRCASVRRRSGHVAWPARRGRARSGGPGRPDLVP